MLRILIAAALALLALPAHAEVPVRGVFTATQACPALQSMRRGTNPGNVETQPGTRYELVAGNASPPTHYWIVMPGAQPERRWVETRCGALADASANTRSAPTPIAQPRHARRAHYVLAVNWQPAFCETAPGKAECRTQSEGDFAATHFSLHGLWPQPRSAEYCDVSETDRWSAENGRWRDLPRLDLGGSVRRELDAVMPGTRSWLDRYEWTKHGTCYGTDANQYYADALVLMRALNQSAVVTLFADNVGRRISRAQISDAFDRSFGPGAGSRVTVACETDGNRTIITELTINLTGDIATAEFATLLASADRAPGGCRSGIVDAVGLR